MDSYGKSYIVAHRQGSLDDYRYFSHLGSDMARVPSEEAGHGHVICSLIEIPDS